MSRSERIRVWTAPLWLGGVSALGLIAALLSDGPGDTIGWLALGTPIGVIIWCLLPDNQRRRRRAVTSGSAHTHD